MVEAFLLNVYILLRYACHMHNLDLFGQTTMSQAAPECANVCGLHSAQPLCCPLHSVESLANAVCVPLSLLSHHTQPGQHPLSHFPIPHLPLCIALIPTAHSPHTTHILHMWHCVPFVHAVCESPSPSVHSSLHQSLSSPQLASSRKRCTTSTADSN